MINKNSIQSIKDEIANLEAQLRAKKQQLETLEKLTPDRLLQCSCSPTSPYLCYNCAIKKQVEREEKEMLILKVHKCKYCDDPAIGIGPDGTKVCRKHTNLIF